MDLPAILRRQMEGQGKSSSYINEMLSKGSARSEIVKIDDRNYRILYDVGTLRYGFAGVIVGLAHEVIAHQVVNEKGLSNLRLEREAFRLEIKYMEALLRQENLRQQFTGAGNIWLEIQRMVAEDKRVITFLDQQIKLGDKAQASNLGGIDMNSANLAMTIKRDGKGVPLPLAQQDMAQLSRIQGFTPIIIEIKPATTLPIFSELQQTPSARPALARAP